MELIIAKCPHCSGRLTVNMDSLSAVCEYCQHTILLKDDTLYKKYNIRVAEEARAAQLTKYMVNAEKSFSYDKVYQFANELLILESNNAMAWLYKSIGAAYKLIENTQNQFDEPLICVRNALKICSRLDKDQQEAIEALLNVAVEKICAAYEMIITRETRNFIYVDPRINPMNNAMGRGNMWNAGNGWTPNGQQNGQVNNYGEQQGSMFGTFKKKEGPTDDFVNQQYVNKVVFVFKKWDSFIEMTKFSADLLDCHWRRITKTEINVSEINGASDVLEHKRELLKKIKDTMFNLDEKRSKKLKIELISRRYSRNDNFKGDIINIIYPSWFSDLKLATGWKVLIYILMLPFWLIWYLVKVIESKHIPFIVKCAMGGGLGWVIYKILIGAGII